MAPEYAGRVFNGVFYQERVTREERRHEFLRIVFTYALLNGISILLIHLTIAPIIDPHVYKPVTAKKVGVIIFRLFSGCWSLITAFYNFVGCVFAIRGFRRWWKDWNNEYELSIARAPQDDVEEIVEEDIEEDEEEYEDAEEELGQSTAVGFYPPAEDMTVSVDAFARNNPYTAVRRMHSGNYAAARKSKRGSYPLEPYRTPADHDPIIEEPADEEDLDITGSDSRDDSGQGREAFFPNLPAAGVSVPRIADLYPFESTEQATSSKAASPNPATATDEPAKENRPENKKKDRKGKGVVRFKNVDDDDDDGKQNATTEGQKATQDTSTTSIDTPTPPKSVGLAQRIVDAFSPNARVETSADRSDGSGSAGATGVRRLRSVLPISKKADPENENPHAEFEAWRTEIVKRMIAYGTHRDQLAVTNIMNNAIWSQVGDHMKRELLLEIQRKEEERRERELMRQWLRVQQLRELEARERAENRATSWRQLRSRELSHGQHSQRPSPSSRSPRARGPAPQVTEASEKTTPETWRHSRWLRFVIFTIGILFCTLVTVVPPFLAIGGDFIAHDYQFIHGCDRARWDITLDASGLHPEKDNIYNRAIFKDRLGRGFEKEFTMNLEGMVTYGAGLDPSLINEHRGYVFYLSKRDLAYQPDGGENVKFPYPVIVAYDIFKHAFYAHEDIWRDLNNEEFFDESAFMNASMSIFPTEGIWLEKEEEDGYCGQPKRLLKNDFDERIIWTLVDDRKDCTTLRVCASRKATRRQVVIAVGTILQRLTLSASCCAKAPGNDATVGGEPWGD
ncbi:hypothetical protein TWF696_002443 [Orbilia brochopaga]|uniref:Uncharacterized protein n=1 Tax=Orbilia brochopaga TaxID=3140254 RepID=A0AAV9U495_9PEZI